MIIFICSIKGLQLKRPVEVQSALLRRYFLELTQVIKAHVPLYESADIDVDYLHLQTFMIPLERYLASLMPLARTISPFRAPPKVNRVKITFISPSIS